MQALKLLIRATLCERNNATGLRELGRSGGKLQLLPLKLKNILGGVDCVTDRVRCCCFSS